MCGRIAVEEGKEQEKTARQAVEKESRKESRSVMGGAEHERCTYIKKADGDEQPGKD